MLAIVKDLCLVRQVGPAAVDEVDARQPVLHRDFLRAEVLLHRQRIISPALHRRIVAHDHAFAARDAADAGDQARAMNIAFIHTIGNQLADLKERRAGIEQPFDTVTRQQLSARHMALAMLLRPAERGLCHLGAQLVSQGAVVRSAGFSGRLFRIILRGQNGSRQFDTPSC